MKKYVFQFMCALMFMVSCGPRPSQSIPEIQREIEAYVLDIDGRTNLEEETIEGALTDADGHKDIGKFRYSVYFDGATKQLYKIKNIERTNVTISETYYFKDSDLVYILTDLGGAPHKMYLQKNTFISENPREVKTQKLLLEKALRFQKMFYNEH